MTDESHGSEPMEEPMTPREEHEESSVIEGAGDFTSGEGLVAFGGIVVVAAWLIFEAIAGEYFIDWTLVLAGAAAALLPRLDRVSVEKVHPLPVAMKVLGYTMGILGVFFLIDDVRFGDLEDIVSVLGALVTYAGCVMGFVGARQIKV